MTQMSEPANIQLRRVADISEGGVCGRSTTPMQDQEVVVECKEHPGGASRNIRRRHFSSLEQWVSIF